VFACHAQGLGWGLVQECDSVCFQSFIVGAESLTTAACGSHRQIAWMWDAPQGSISCEMETCSTGQYCCIPANDSPYCSEDACSEDEILMNCDDDADCATGALPE
jgi:hypothetical protein